ncbi:hypothetical protein KKG05_07680, partial [bacterium]|nr:hypothetical protein [bacterium]
MICFWLLFLICFPVTLTASSLDLGVSNSNGCQFVYKPGPPSVMSPDTIRAGAMVRGWADTDEKIAGGLCQPVRHIYIVVPPGTMAVLNVQGLRTHTESGGLAQPPPEWQTVEISRAPEAFVKLVGVFRWRDFRLAHVELYPVREAAGGAALLDEVQCFIEFEGTQTGARTPKDVRVLSRLA